MSFLLQFENASFAYFAENEARPCKNGFLIRSQALSLSHALRDGEFYRHGWHSWSPVAWRKIANPVSIVEPATRRLQCDDRRFATSSVHGGNWCGAIRAHANAPCLFVGSLDLEGRVEADGEELRAFFQAEVAGEWFVTHGEASHCFERYAKLLSERYGNSAQRPIPKVWCSWYSHYQKISEPILQPTLDEARDYGFDVFQLDDGWQQDIGDWDANTSFPKGMATYAQEISRRGMEPGIWLAPLLVRPTSKMFAQHKDWLIKDDNNAPLAAGFNWGTTTYALDTTHPEVCEWLVNLFKTVSGWGYSYLKLDFMYAGALTGRRHGAANGEQAYRDALTLIRKTVGSDAYLLLCGAPILPTLGIADGLRIGPDVAPYWDKEERSFMMNDTSWPSTRNAVRTCAHRLWLSSLVHCDPDVAYFRTRYNLLDDEKRDLLVSLAEITRFKATSDPIEWLLEGEAAALKAFLKHSPNVKRVSEFCYEIDGRKVDFATYF